MSIQRFTYRKGGKGIAGLSKPNFRPAGEDIDEGVLEGRSKADRGRKGLQGSYRGYYGGGSDRRSRARATGAFALYIRSGGSMERLDGTAVRVCRLDQQQTASPGFYRPIRRSEPA